MLLLAAQADAVEPKTTEAQTKEGSLDGFILYAQLESQRLWTRYDQFATSLRHLRPPHTDLHSEPARAAHNRQQDPQGSAVRRSARARVILLIAAASSTLQHT